MFSEAATSGNGGAASAGEIVAIGAGDAFNDAELAEAREVSGEGGGRAAGEEWQQVGAAEAWLRGLRNRIKTQTARVLSV